MPWARAPRLVRGFRLAHLGVVRHVGGGRVDRLGRALGQLVGGDFRFFERHALGVVGFLRLALLAGLVRIGLLVAFVFAFLAVAGAVLAHVEAVEQIANDIAEPPLVVEQASETVEVATGAVLDPWPPHVDELLGGGRRSEPGEPLAHHHGDGIFDGRVGPVTDVVELAAMKAVLEHGGEVARHALHAARADRLDPRLLDRLEHRARLLAARHQAAMHVRIMAGELERDRIGVTAHDRRLDGVELARRLGQPCLAAGETGPLGSVADFELGLARDRFEACGDRALERLGRRLPRRALAFEIGGHRITS